MTLHRLLRAIVARMRASARRPATLFIGSGDRFDDDRRLVRIAITYRPTAHPGRKP